MALSDTVARVGDLLAMRLIVPAAGVLIDDAREAAWAALRPLKPDALSGEESRAALVNALDAAIARLQELRNLMQEFARRGGGTASGPRECPMYPPTDAQSPASSRIPAPSTSREPTSISARSIPT